MADNYKQLNDSAAEINRKLARDPVQDVELHDLQEKKVTNIKLSLAELDALNNETYLMNTYKAREVSGWLTQGAYVVGRFYHHVDCSSKKGFVQVIISNYVVEEDGTINSAALATSDIMQTTIAERKCAINGSWSKWVKLSDEIDKELATLGSKMDELVGGDGKELVPLTSTNVNGDETGTVTIIPNTLVNITAGTKVIIDFVGYPDITGKWSYSADGESLSNHVVRDSHYEFVASSFIQYIRIAVAAPTTADGLQGVSGTLSARISVSSGEGVIQRLQNDVDELKDDVSNLQNNVSDIDTLKLQCGEKRYKQGDINVAWISPGGVKGVDANNKIVIGTSASYAHAIVQAKANDVFDIFINQTTSANYQHYVHFTNSDDILIATAAPLPATQSAYEYHIVVPNNANIRKMYVTNAVSAVNTPWIKGNSIYSLQEQIDNIGLDVDTDDTVEKIGLPLLNDAKSLVLQKITNSKCLNFAMITDTHYRIDEDKYAANNMELFVKSSEWDKIDFCFHGGDIISKYGLIRQQGLSYLEGSMDILSKINRCPLYITKGNHEYMDTANEGIPNGIDREHINNFQFWMMCQNGLAVMLNTDEPIGGYFYKDFESSKVRVVLINEYLSREEDDKTYKSFGKEIKWFAEVALNIPSGYDVVVLTHVQLTGSAENNGSGGYWFDNILKAFNNGSQISGTYIDGETTYNADYSSIGSGHLIGVIRGHAHKDEYTKASGYNDIGMIHGFVPKRDVGTEKEYKFSIFTIDSVNKRIYETRVGQQWLDTSNPNRAVDRSWSYGSISEQLT